MITGMREYMKRNYLISILCMVILLLLNVISYIGDGNVNMIDYIVYMTFGYPEINTASLMYILTFMLPFVIFQIFNGINIYMNLSEGSIYTFYRYSSRRKWLIKQIMIQFFLCILFSALYIFTGMILVGMILKTAINHEALILGVWAVLNIGFWLTACTLLINFLSFVRNSAFGIVAVEGIQTMFMTAMLFFQPMGALDIYQGDYIERNIRLLKFNPMAHLITSWHSSNNAEINQFLQCNDIDISLILSPVIWGVAAVIVAIVFIYRIKKIDIIEDRRD